MWLAATNGFLLALKKGKPAVALPQARRAAMGKKQQPPPPSETFVDADARDGINKKPGGRPTAHFSTVFPLEKTRMVIDGAAERRLRVAVLGWDSGGGCARILGKGGNLLRECGGVRGFYLHVKHFSWISSVAVSPVYRPAHPRVWPGQTVCWRQLPHISSQTLLVVTE